MSNGHTPGPWLLQETTVYALNEERAPVNRFTACIDSGWRDSDSRISRDEVEANARLIAAEPELLEALDALVIAYCDPGNQGSDHDEKVDAALAAIAKARGTA